MTPESVVMSHQDRNVVIVSGHVIEAVVVHHQVILGIPEHLAGDLIQRFSCEEVLAASAEEEDRCKSHAEYTA
jgi:hypothetical protein